MRRQPWSRCCRLFGAETGEFIVHRRLKLADMLGVLTEVGSADAGAGAYLDLGGVPVRSEGADLNGHIIGEEIKRRFYLILNTVRGCIRLDYLPAGKAGSHCGGENRGVLR
jgi:hypothetical protein